MERKGERKRDMLLKEEHLVYMYIYVYICTHIYTYTYIYENQHKMPYLYRSFRGLPYVRTIRSIIHYTPLYRSVTLPYIGY